MSVLPTGTITFLFTDIEGSTRLWDNAPEAMSPALARHEAIVRAAIEAHDGHVFKTLGDAYCAAFPTAAAALQAALAAQRSLAVEPWAVFGPDFPGLRVRMALHSGAAEARDGDYFGPALNRVARLMAAGHGGQVLLSLATEELVRDDLPVGVSLRDMGERRLKDLRRPEHVFQVLAEGMAADFPALATLDARPNNLPIQLTSFVGREREMADVKRLLGTSPLVTLTGVGGTGKTRLALQVAADLIDDYDHGVWFVDLAPIQDAALVGSALASALGVREEPGRLIEETLTEFTKERRLLVVLDNCEQVVASCAVLADGLLRMAPGLRILATSREALAIGGEVVWPVSPLETPDPAQLVRSAEAARQLSQFEAVRLFIDRAAAVRPDFRVTNANAPAVAEICHRLDGIPLAIELAAARVKVLAVEQIEARLGERFQLLTGGSRTALPRQQTLRAAIDWSHDLLDEAERTVFRRLAVFRGGWTLAAAEAVCGGEGVEATEVLDVLSHLVDKSLIVVSEGEAGETRYGYLETVRQYSGEKLSGSGERDRVEEAYMTFFLHLAEEAAPQLEGSDQSEWLSRLRADHDNLNGALDGMVSIGDVVSGLRLGGALWRYWVVNGDWTEGRKRLASVLALPTRPSVASEGPRAEALHGAGDLARQQGDHDMARSLIEESLAIQRAHANGTGIASCLGSLGNVAWERRDYPAARRLFEDCLTYWRELGNLNGIGKALGNLGSLAGEQGDYQAARTLNEEALTLARALGDKYGVAITLLNLSHVAVMQGDYRAAVTLDAECLAIARELGDKSIVCDSLQIRGTVAQLEGDYLTALTCFEEMLAISRELGRKHGIAFALNDLGNTLRRKSDLPAARSQYEASLEVSRLLDDRRAIAQSLCGLGRIALSQQGPTTARPLLEESLVLRRALVEDAGTAESLLAIGLLNAARMRWEQSAQIIAAAEKLRDEISIRLDQESLDEHNETLAACRAALGDAAFNAAWARGQAMTLDEAVALALAEWDGDDRLSVG